MIHELQAALDYSSRMVKARRGRNHLIKPKINKTDLSIINQIGYIMGIKNVINKIKNHEK